MENKPSNQQSDFRMTPVKKVLIALDFDTTARKVAEEGYSLARAMGAQTVIIHVIAEDIYYSSLEYSPVTGFSGFSNADFSLMASSEGLSRASEYFLDSIKGHLKDDSIVAVIEKGDFADMILKTAREIQADLIVIGTHSRRWLDQILMGSVTEKVLHNTTVPLYIVPTKGHGKK